MRNKKRLAESKKYRVFRCRISSARIKCATNPTDFKECATNVALDIAPNDANFAAILDDGRGVDAALLASLAVRLQLAVFQQKLETASSALQGVVKAMEERRN